jgi:hypothetical protein
MITYRHIRILGNIFEHPNYPDQLLMHYKLQKMLLYLRDQGWPMQMQYAVQIYMSHDHLMH